MLNVFIYFAIIVLIMFYWGFCMSSVIRSLFFVGSLGAAIIAPQAISAEDIDFSQAKLLLEITAVTIVSKEVKDHSARFSIQAVCDESKKNCDPSEEQEEVEERRVEERWWEDDRGDEWYERAEYYKYEDSEIWDLVSKTQAKKGTTGFVSRPEG